jgi:hypothetical protein
MVEVGVYDGASLALCAELVHPHKLVGIDNRVTPSAALDSFLARRHLQEIVRPYFGVDQVDTVRLDQIVATEFDTEPLDLIVDDASHLLDATRTTFNCLFPRLRPGGVYLVEDWPIHRFLIDRPPNTNMPLTLLIVELMLACNEAPDVIAKVTVDKNYALVLRGNAELTPGSFNLAAYHGKGARAFLAAFRRTDP